MIDAMLAMEPIDMGLWVTGFMLLMVIIGVRVAFAAAIAGFCGLLWYFTAKLGFEKAFWVTVNMAGTVPHSKVSTSALSLIPVFILIGFLAYHAGLTRALFAAAKRWGGWLPGGMAIAGFLHPNSCCDQGGRVWRRACPIRAPCRERRRSCRGDWAGRS